MLKDGFYTALGTPVDERGRFIEASFRRHVEDQVKAGASGLLVMGTMGIQPCIRDEDFGAVAAAAVDVAAGRCPVFVGVMDNSVGRVMDRVWGLEGLQIHGVVATTPYYFVSTQPEICNFYKQLAEESPFPVYMYDLPTVTKVKISTDTALEVLESPNVRGIKTADMAMARILIRERAEADVLFSGLDVMDVAYSYGLKKGLDGMFSATPGLTADFYKALAAEDYHTAGGKLDAILKLRNLFLEVGVFRGFTHAMNLLGLEGRWGPDYLSPLSDTERESVRECMIECGCL